MDQEETEPCTNCKKLIPLTKYDTHEVYCLRNIKKC